MAVTRRVHGGYMAGTWRVRGGYVAGTWRVRGRYVAGTWRVHGGYMVGIWSSQPRGHRRAAAHDSSAGHAEARRAGASWRRTGSFLARDGGWGRGSTAAALTGAHTP